MAQGESRQTGHFNIWKHLYLSHHRLGIDGRRDVPTECFANEANREQFVCRQLIPVVIALGR
jgi:hypothetical protein